MSANTIPSTLSSLELMLEQIQKREEQPKDVPPALPTRPVIRARLPRSRSRLLPFRSQNNNVGEDTENQNMSSFLESKWDRCGVFVDSLHHQESSDRICGAAVGSSAFLVESVNGSTQKLDSSNNEDGIAKKIDNFDDRKEASVQQKLGIQRHLYGHQTCFCNHELDKGVITLQSFIRGENARKYFAKKMAAIAVIQKRVKSQLRSRLLEEEDQAVIYLQASIRGLLALRHFNSIDRREKQLTGDARNIKNLEKKLDQVEVPYSVLVDLQRRVLKTEALLDKKKEEHASLRLQIKQLERKRLQFETKMNSMEKTWQDQLTSMQASLAETAAKKSSYSKNSVGKLGMLFSLPENHDEDAHDSPLSIRSRLNSDQIIIDDHRKEMSDENAGISIIENESAREASTSSTINPEEELQKLKLKFKTWKKGFKTKLIVAKAKTTVKKLGNSEGERSSHKKWWGR